MFPQKLNTFIEISKYLCEQKITSSAKFCIILSTRKFINIISGIDDLFCSHNLDKGEECSDLKKVVSKFFVFLVF